MVIRAPGHGCALGVHHPPAQGTSAPQPQGGLDFLRPFFNHHSHCLMGEFHRAFYGNSNQHAPGRDLREGEAACGVGTGLVKHAIDLAHLDR